MGADSDARPGQIFEDYQIQMGAAGSWRLPRRRGSRDGFTDLVEGRARWCIVFTALLVRPLAPLSVGYLARLLVNDRKGDPDTVMGRRGLEFMRSKNEKSNKREKAYRASRICSTPNLMNYPTPPMHVGVAQNCAGRSL